MVNLAEEISASVYLGLLKDYIFAILVHPPPPKKKKKNHQVEVEKYKKN